MNNNKIIKLAKKWGADLVGIAGLANVQDAVIHQGGNLVANYPFAISMGISLLDTIVDQLPERQNRACAVSYRHHCYDIINTRLDILASRLSSLLQNKGYKAFPIPASKRVDDDKLCAVFSHKMAAHLAGLGWIGKSCLLITPEHGPRVRFVTILTNAPLKITGKPLKEKCGECNLCVNICPVGAFTGTAFKPGEPRETRYDAHKCDKYFTSIKKKNEWAVCGMCLYICPYGRK